MQDNAAVFLDRDGVINVDRGYLHRVEDFELVPGAIEAMQEICRRGMKIVIVTNQSGIGRGYYSEEDYQAVSRFMLSLLAKNKIEVAAVYHCPHTPDDGCQCRKPQPGMILRGIGEFAIDPGKSWLVGDKTSDIAAARAAGIHRTVLVRSGQPVDPVAAKALYVVDSIRDMIPLLNSQGRESQGD